MLEEVPSLASEDLLEAASMVVDLVHIAVGLVFAEMFAEVLALVPCKKGLVGAGLFDLSDASPVLILHHNSYVPYQRLPR